MSADPSPGDVEAAFAEHAARLAQLRFPDALAVGDRAPEFALPNAHGETVRLSELLARGPVALAFYRGAWCPYCNAHLRALQEALPEVRALGGSLAAISPQTPDHSLTMAERNELEFEVLSDPSSYVASDYGIVFTLGHADRELFLAVGNDVGAVNGAEAWLLPAPSLFVIDRRGVVRFAHVHPDYTRRIDPAAVLEALRRLP